jgi:tetratricopeptide (TPR) repeat protein
MKASASPKLLVITVLALAGSLVRLPAEDVVVLKNGQRRPGTILKISGGQLKLKVGPAETGIPMNQVVSVTMAPPKSYLDALQQWKDGDAAKTLETLKPLVEKFLGLPTPWAERSAALLGDVYLSLDRIPEAEAAFTTFQTAYPDSGSLSDIGLARLAVTKGDYAAARGKLIRIVEEAVGVKMAPAGKSAMYGQAFYLMGIIRESEGTQPEALQDYLTAVTLFHEDDAIAAKARERADILIEKNVIVP